MNYPVGDFLIQIKNASLAGRRAVVVRETKLIKNVASVLKKLGLLAAVSSKGGLLTAELRYHKKAPMLIGLKLVSKPGMRTYTSVDKLSKRRGAERLVISTNQGVMTDEEAVKKNIGGEVIAKII